MDLQETLLGYERELSRGDGDAYRRLLADDAVVIVPGATLDKPSTAAAIDDSPGWDSVEMHEPQLLRPTEDVAILTYRFAGQRRPDASYEAQLTSVYTGAGGQWRLVLHQHTPPGDSGG